MSRQSSRIGLQGELRVAQILTGSEHPNIIKESFLPYDIIWEGIKINVKTTTITVRSSKGACSFYINLTGRHNDIVIVFAALLGDDEYFWVDKYRQGMKGYFKLSDAVTADGLASKVREANKIEVTPIDEKFRTRQPINVELEHFNEIVALRDKLKDQRGLKSMSLRQTVMEGIKLLERKVGK